MKHSHHLITYILPAWAFPLVNSDILRFEQSISQQCSTRLNTKGNQAKPRERERARIRRDWHECMKLFKAVSPHQCFPRPPDPSAPCDCDSLAPVGSVMWFSRNEAASLRSPSRLPGDSHLLSLPVSFSLCPFPLVKGPISLKSETLSGRCSLTRLHQPDAHQGSNWAPDFTTVGPFYSLQAPTTFWPFTATYTVMTCKLVHHRGKIQEGKAIKDRNYISYTMSEYIPDHPRSPTPL